VSEPNARDLVLREILRGNPGMTEERAEDLIDALVDSVAHELADEQRAMVAHHGMPLDSYGEVLVCGLIDHIDPHVPFAEGGPARREDEEPDA
jgi:hypothetical protein